MIAFRSQCVENSFPTKSGDLGSQQILLNTTAEKQVRRMLDLTFSGTADPVACRPVDDVVHQAGSDSVQVRRPDFQQLQCIPGLGRRLRRQPCFRIGRVQPVAV